MAVEPRPFRLSGARVACKPLVEATSDDFFFFTTATQSSSTGRAARASVNWAAIASVLLGWAALASVGNNVVDSHTIYCK